MNETSHFSRLLGLLFAVAVLSVASRWLLTPDGPTAPADTVGEPAGGDMPLRTAEASVGAAAPAPVPAERLPMRLGRSAAASDTVPVAAARPISAALCHALDERLRALDHQATLGKLPKHELRTLRAERQRARELLQGLRCRPGGDRYWF